MWGELDDFSLVEETIKQTGLLHELNPSSVNTMRVNTLIDDGIVTVLCCFFRTGRAGQVTDNFHAGGIKWQVDIKTGRILHGCTVQGEIVDTHTDSKICVSGLKIPDFEKALDMCRKAHLLLPEVPQIGWDVCISDDGISLIEGNSGSAVCNAEKDNNVWGIMKKYLYKHHIVLTDVFDNRNKYSH